MENIIIIILLVAVIFLAWEVLRKKNDGGAEKNAAIMERLTVLSEQNQDLRRAMERNLSEVNRTTQKQHESAQTQMNQTIRTVQDISSQSARLIGDVTEKLTKLDETNRQVVNFSAQLQNLQDILKNPKQRGILGEYFLEETLKNVLPPNAYQMQYGFKDGTIVDAAIFLQNKIIPVDSKFSLENYEKILNSKDEEERANWEKLFKQDLKNRIDETSKYIKPSENTMDFAFMFIPSEAIYYDLLINKVGAVQVNTRDLIEYAFRDKKVIIVSPTSFFAYLQTVLQGLRALQIEESAKEIRANVEKLGRHMSVYNEFLKKLGISIGSSCNHYNNACKEFKKINKDVTKITGAESEIEVVLLEKPQTDLE